MMDWRGGFDRGVLSYVSVREAAVILGVRTQRVYQLLQSGALAGLTSGGTRLVSVRSLEARLALMEKEGGR